VDEFWVFSSITPHTVSDPDRHPLVLGNNLTSDWDILLTELDPWGNAMPYAGIKFILKPGGTPFDPSDIHAVFLHPTVPIEGEAILTDIWHDADGYHTELGYVQHIWSDPIPSELPDYRSKMQYVWDHSIIPEPTTMLLLASGLVGVAGFRRKLRQT
jgi:hypothetical protein